MELLDENMGCKVLFLILCMLIVPTIDCRAITLEQLRNTITETKDSMTSARLRYIKEYSNNEAVEGQGGSAEQKIAELNRHRLVEVNAAVDIRTGQAKISKTDLRDVDAMLTENELPPERKLSLCLTGTSVSRGAYELWFVDTNVMNGPALIDFHKLPPHAESPFDFLCLGIVDKSLLSDENNPRLSQVTQDGRSILRVELSCERPGGMVHATINCDPTLRYRFRRIQWVYNGNVYSEIIADDYRTVNDIQYPFTYIERTFDKSDGKLVYERKITIEQAQFGIPLTSKDFKVFVPSGTTFTDAAISMRVSKIGLGRLFGIDDALAMGREMERNR